MEPQGDNPYDSPEDTELAASETAAFSGTVQASDVRRGLQSVYVTVFLIAVSAGFLILAVVALAAGSGASRIIFVALFLATLFGAISYMLGRTGKRFATKFPSSIGEVQGVLSNKRIEFEWSLGKAWASSRVLQVATVNRHGMLISTGLQYYIPASIFEDFDTARQIASDLNSSASTMALGAPELRSPVNPEQLPDRPGDALPLEGPVFASDLDDTAIGKVIRKAGRGWIWLLATSLIVGGLCWAISDSWQLGFCVTVGFFLFFWFGLYRRVYKQLRELNTGSDGSPVPAYYIAGWVNDEWLVTETNLGGGQYRWDAFAYHQILDDDRVALRLPGKTPHIILLTRQLCRSNEDWSRTLDLISRRVETE